MSQYDILRRIFERLADHERRLAGSEMRGPVKQVDPDKAKVRLSIGKDEDGNDVLSPWVPYAQTAGAMKIHNPPSIGQVMAVRAESGDIEQGAAHPFHWTDKNKAPSKSGEDHVITIGAFTITLNGSVLSVKGPRVLLDCDGATFELTGAGLKMVAPDYQFD